MSILTPMASHVLRDMTDAYRARMEQMGEVFSDSATVEEARQEAMRDALGAAGLKWFAECREHNHEYHDGETRPEPPEIVTTWQYHAIPSDEPPPASMVRAAQKHADNTGETVRIEDVQGRLYRVIEAEV